MPTYTYVTWSSIFFGGIQLTRWVCYISFSAVKFPVTYICWRFKWYSLSVILPKNVICVNPAGGLKWKVPHALLSTTKFMETLPWQPKNYKSALICDFGMRFWYIIVQLVSNHWMYIIKSELLTKTVALIYILPYR